MLNLRRLREEDLEETFKWRNDPLIYEWCRQYAPLHFINHVNWFKNQAHDQSQSMFAIEKDKIILGVCGLTSINQINKNAEFSLYIGPEYQGKKNAKKGLMHLLHHGFHDLGLNRIWGEVFDKNPAYNMFIKLGFEHEGIRKESYYRDGNFIDSHLISFSHKHFDSILDAAIILISEEQACLIEEELGPK